MGLRSRTFWHHPAFGQQRWRMFARQPVAGDNAHPLETIDHHLGLRLLEDQSDAQWVDIGSETKYRRCKVVAGGHCHYYRLRSYLVTRGSQYVSGYTMRRVNRSPTSKPVVVCVHEFTVCVVPVSYYAWRDANKDTRWVREDGKDRPTLLQRLRGAVRLPRL